MATTIMNKQWLLASRPAGEATVDNFRLVETPRIFFISKYVCKFSLYSLFG